MPPIHARFFLAEDARASFWTADGYKEAAKIKLAAAKGEPFGPATPQGTVEMLIVNPEAVKVFREATLGQEFDVTFTPVQKSE